MSRPIPSLMGGGASTRRQNEQPNANSRPSITSTTGSNTWTEDYPFKQRRYAVDKLCDVIKKVKTLKSDHAWREEFSTELQNVRQLLLINEAENLDESKSLLLDKTSCELVSLIEELTSKKPPDWPHECAAVCHVLAAHICAPEIPGQIPDTEVTNLVVFNLVNIRVRTKKGLTGLLTVLQKNKGLEKVELGYTGITVELFTQAYPHIVKLQKLAYLGLRGNRLNVSVIPVIQKSLENRKTLPTLMWIDLANNIDILSIPLTLLDLIKKRWPTDYYHPTFRELLDSKIVVHKALFHINL